MPARRRFDRLAIERRQVWFYLASITLGLVLGSVLPEFAPVFHWLLWPALAVLLYATFLQMPLLHVRAEAGGRR